MGLLQRGDAGRQPAGLAHGQRVDRGVQRPGPPGMSERALVLDAGRCPGEDRILASGVQRAAAAQQPGQRDAVGVRAAWPSGSGVGRASAGGLRRGRPMIRTAKKSHAIWTRNGEHAIITRFSHDAWYRNREGVTRGTGLQVDCERSLAWGLAQQMALARGPIQPVYSLLGQRKMP